MEKRTKYPRTFHLPWSPGLRNDDRVLERGTAGWGGREVVVSEKMDGESCTMYRDGLHARSLDSGAHPSRTHVQAIHGRVAHEIPEDMRVCGENMAAVHSVRYERLRSYFLVFGVWRGDLCLSWDDTVDWAMLLGLRVVPVIWRGPYSDGKCRELAAALDTERQEGLVARPAAAFTMGEFPAVVGKWVRGRHVQTDEHWMRRPVEYNGLEEGA